MIGMPSVSSWVGKTYRSAADDGGLDVAGEAQVGKLGVHGLADLGGDEVRRGITEPDELDVGHVLGKLHEIEDALALEIKPDAHDDLIGRAVAVFFAEGAAVGLVFLEEIGVDAVADGADAGKTVALQKPLGIRRGGDDVIA